MEQRDFITREIERIAQVLGRLLTRLAGLNSGGVGEQSSSAVCYNALREELNLDTDKLLQLSRCEAIEYLTNELNFTPEHLEILQDILLAVADDPETDSSRRRNLHRLVLMIADYLEHDLQRFSFSRLETIGRLREELMYKC